MDAQDHGTVPGLAAPEAASNLCPAGAASVAGAAVSTAALNTQKDSAPVAQATQSREQIEHSNSATGAGSEKAFLALQALLALKGYSLSRTAAIDGPVHYVIRWDLVRKPCDIAAVAGFVRQVGGAA